MLKNLQKLMMLCLMLVGISMNANAWVPTVSPATGSVERIGQIVITPPAEVGFLDQFGYSLLLTKPNGDTDYVYFNISFDDWKTGNSADLNLTAPGTYSLALPAGALTSGGTSNEACTFTWTIGGGGDPEPTNYSLNINPSIANGTVSVSGNLTQAQAGDVITLSANPASGYQFSSWNVTNATTSATITVTNNQFTMPTANVNISAVFSPVGGGGSVDPVLTYDAENCKITVTWPEGTVISQVTYDSPSISDYSYYWWFNILNNTLSSSYVHIDNDGDYTLTIPAGAYMINGMPNEQIVIPFTVGDPSAPVDIEITSALYATFVPNADVDISSNDDVEAYVVTSVNGGYISMAQTTQVPKGKAVIVKADAAGTYQVSKMDGATLSAENLLKVSAGFHVNEDYTYYVLADGENGVGFYPVQRNSDILENKGYLKVTGGLASYRMSFGEATDIKGVIFNKLDGSREIYDLNGQRVNANAKGIIIVNGKKVLR